MADAILAAHAHDVAAVVSCDMTKAEAASLRHRLILRLADLEEVAPATAALLRAGITAHT